MSTKAQLEQELLELRLRFAKQEAEEEAAPLAELAEEEFDPEGDLELFLQEAGGPGPDKIVDGYWYDDDGDGRLRFVNRWPLNQFSLPAVRDAFGGGRWVFRLKHADTGKFIRSKTQLIDGPRKENKSPGPEEDPRTFPDRVLDSQAMIMETFKELRAGPPAGAPAVDPINMALSIVGAFQSVMAPMQEALLNKEKTEPSFGELVTIFQQGIEMGKMSAPAPADPMGQVLAAALPGLMSAIRAGENAPSPVDVLTNPPGAEELPAMARKPPPSTRPPWDVLLAGYMPALLKWARADADFVLRAAFVVDELPPEAEAILLEQLRRGPEFFREFMLLHPEAKPWEEWLANFWLAVADQFEWGTEEMGPHPFLGSRLALDVETVDEEPGPEVGPETN